MKVTWQVKANTPKTTIIPDDELNDCETEGEKQKLISHYIREDLGRKMIWEILYIEE